MLDLIELAALLLALILCLLGIFHDELEDNTLQRVGMAVIGFAAACQIYLLLTPSNCCQAVRVNILFEVGFAIYGLGTVQKVLKYKATD